MKTRRVRVFTFAAVVFSLALPILAQADVRALIDGIYGPTLAYGPTQVLTRPAAVEFTRWGTDVAVDGSYIIVLAGYAGGQRQMGQGQQLGTGDRGAEAPARRSHAAQAALHGRSRRGRR